MTQHHVKDAAPHEYSGASAIPVVHRELKRAQEVELLWDRRFSDAPSRQIFSYSPQEVADEQEPTAPDLGLTGRGAKADQGDLLNRRQSRRG